MRSRWTAMLAGFSLILTAGTAGAVTFSYDFTDADYETSEITGVWGAGAGPSWANDAGIDAAHGGPTRLRLTGNTGGQRGNAWVNAATYAANAAWDVDFTFQITYEQGGGADGMAFHVQEIGPNVDTYFRGDALGASFLSVAIDTWNNGDECSVEFGLAIYNNGSQSGSCVDLSGLGSLANDRYQVSMSHDGSGSLTIDVTNMQTANSTGSLLYAVDLAALDAATLGFSAQTGGAGENHDVLDLSGNFVPEPGTGLLVGLGLAGLAGYRRRMN